MAAGYLYFVYFELIERIIYWGEIMKKLNFTLVILLILVLGGCKEETKDLRPSQIEAGGITISEDVTLAVTVDADRMMHSIMTNNGDVPIDHGWTISVEKKIDGTWYRLTEIAAYADESHVLEPGKEWVQKDDLDNWIGSGGGTFRLYKTYSTDPTRPYSETEEYTLSNEFEAEK